jgi:hypothetical protein
MKALTAVQMDIGIMRTANTHILVLYEYRNTSAVFAVDSHKDNLCLFTVLRTDV